MADDELKDELKLNIDLCVKVEKHPCLYDITRDDHSKRQILEKAWAEISGKVGLSGYFIIYYFYYLFIHTLTLFIEL